MLQSNKEYWLPEDSPEEDIRMVDQFTNNKRWWQFWIKQNTPEDVDRLFKEYREDFKKIYKFLETQPFNKEY